MEKEYEKEIEFLKSEVKRLQECVGSWRRLAQEKKSRKECVREGWTADYGGYHYKVYEVNDVPGDLSISEVVKSLEKEFLPAVAPYRLKRIDYSQKYSAWLIQVEKPLQIDVEKFFELKCVSSLKHR
jgi:hypothetical protein